MAVDCADNFDQLWPVRVCKKENFDRTCGVGDGRSFAVGPLCSCGALCHASSVSEPVLRLIHGGVFGQSLYDSVLLMLSGPLTATPLIFFSYAAKRIPMATLGLLNYVNPTLQFFCAVAIFGEPIGGVQIASFGLIWLALALYSGDSFRRERVGRI